MESVHLRRTHRRKGWCLANAEEVREAVLCAEMRVRGNLRRYSCSKIVQEINVRNESRIR